MATEQPQFLNIVRQAFNPKSIINSLVPVWKSLKPDIHNLFNNLIKPGIFCSLSGHYIPTTIRVIRDKAYEESELEAKLKVEGCYEKQQRMRESAGMPPDLLAYFAFMGSCVSTVL